MRIVPIRSVREGMELARDIPNPKAGGVPLLRSGVSLSERLAGRLARESVRAVWVKDDLGEGIDPVVPLPDDVRRSSEEALAMCVSAATKALAAGTSISEVALQDVEEAAVAISEALEECPEAALAFDDLAAADAYSHTHSVRVTTLGVLLGQRIVREEGWVDWEKSRRFDDLEDRMVRLGMGLLLHDIGKATLPEEILHKQELNDEETKLYRSHPEAGVALLPVTRVSPLTIGVVRSHHERFDGLGFPHGRVGQDIHQFARIAAVADTYDNTIAERFFKPASPPHVGVKAVQEGSGSRFDPMVVEHFSRLVMPYPVGHSFELPGGAIAAVVSVSPDRPEHPVVRYRDASGTLIEATMHIVDAKVIEGY
jgi:HD-GYP domain-containing protein (c-di-GMP phosphodiesterase class II)